MTDTLVQKFLEVYCSFDSRSKFQENLLEGQLNGKV